MSQGFRGVFEPEEKFGAESGAENGRNYDPRAGLGGQEIALFSTCMQIETEAGNVSQGFQNEVRGDAPVHLAIIACHQPLTETTLQCRVLL